MRKGLAFAVEFGVHELERGPNRLRHPQDSRVFDPLDAARARQVEHRVSRPLRNVDAQASQCRGYVRPVLVEVTTVGHRTDQVPALEFGRYEDHRLLPQRWAAVQGCEFLDESIGVRGDDDDALGVFGESIEYRAPVLVGGLDLDRVGGVGGVVEIESSDGDDGAQLRQGGGEPRDDGQSGDRHHSTVLIERHSLGGIEIESVSERAE